MSGSLGWKLFCISSGSIFDMLSFGSRVRLIIQASYTHSCIYKVHPAPPLAEGSVLQCGVINAMKWYLISVQDRPTCNSCSTDWKAQKDWVLLMSRTLRVSGNVYHTSVVPNRNSPWKVSRFLLPCQAYSRWQYHTLVSCDTPHAIYCLYDSHTHKQMFDM